MAEALTIARPYAEAALEFASAAGTTAGWSKQLAVLAAVAADEQARRLLQHPRVTPEQREALFIDVAGTVVDDGGRNFIRLLSEYNRLIILPQIYQEYQRLLAIKEQKIAAQVCTAQPLSDEQLSELTTALKQRFQCAVELEEHVDPSLLGGALIQVGDLVIDGTLRGRLNRMTSALRNF